MVCKTHCQGNRETVLKLIISRWAEGDRNIGAQRYRWLTCIDKFVFQMKTCFKEQVCLDGLHHFHASVYLQRMLGSEMAIKHGGSSQKGHAAGLSVTASKLCFVRFFIFSVSMVTTEVRGVKSWAKYSFCKVKSGFHPWEITQNFTL